MLMTPLAASLIGFPGGMELIIIFVIVLLLFGGAKLPQLARSMGQAMRNFRDETSKLKREVEHAADEEDKKNSQANTANASSSSKASNQSQQGNSEEPAVEQKN